MVASLSSSSPPQRGSSSESPAAPSEKKPQREQPRIRRRNRLITSCLECRRRKLKCDKLQPCSNCTKFSRDCLFITPALDPAGQAKLAEVKEKMGMLERTLEQDVARRGSSGKQSTRGLLNSAPLPGQEGHNSEEDDDDEFRGLEPTSLVVEDCAYAEDEGNDEIVDLGISMGKLRITERVGGLVRPRFSEELAQALSGVRRRNIQNPFTEQSPETWMSPGRDYVAPSSSFFFGPNVQKTSLTTHLPSQVLVDKLLVHYWKAVHPIARTLHRPSFERQYNKFWTDINAGVEPRTSFQAVVFAALLSSAISMSGEKVMTEFAVDKANLVENFKLGAEAALVRANFLQTTKLETLQGFVMYLIPLCRAEVSRAHSALTGTCIRLAECMSLHRDPSHYTADPVEIHVRRLVWYQICFLDMRTCEATGPRPQIRREEYDTKFPLNVDDRDLEAGVEITEDRPYFTDITITRMRFECHEMHRLIWIDRPKIEAKKITLTSELSKIQKFCQAMERTYLPMLDKTHPLHVLAMEIYGILSCRMYIMVLQKFASNEHRLMPERLRQITISTAVMILEHSMAIEQTPALADWAWYIGAINSYHVALLLLSELYAKERDPAVEARVWRCLDFVFELPGGLQPIEKTRMVLEELVGRTQAYQAARRFRAPAHMEHAGPRKSYGVVSEDAEHTASDRGLRTLSTQSGASAFTMSSGHPGPDLSGIGHYHQAPTAEYPSTYGVLVPPSAGGQPPTSVVAGCSTAAETQGFPMAGYSADTAHTAVAATVPSGLQQHEQLGQSHHQGPAEPTQSTLGPAFGQGSGQLEALPDIDWTEWDQLFGTAEMSSSILIPPYTFPQLSAADLQLGLQWPPSEGL